MMQTCHWKPVNFYRNVDVTTTNVQFSKLSISATNWKDERNRCRTYTHTRVSASTAKAAKHEPEIPVSSIENYFLTTQESQSISQSSLPRLDCAPYVCTIRQRWLSVWHRVAIVSLFQDCIFPWLSRKRKSFVLRFDVIASTWTTSTRKCATQRIILSLIFSGRRPIKADDIVAHKITPSHFVSNENAFVSFSQTCVFLPVCVLDDERFLSHIISSFHEINLLKFLHLSFKIMNGDVCARSVSYFGAKQNSLN